MSESDTETSVAETIGDILVEMAGDLVWLRDNCGEKAPEVTALWCKIQSLVFNEPDDDVVIGALRFGIRQLEEKS